MDPEFRVLYAAMPFPGVSVTGEGNFVATFLRDVKTGEIRVSAFHLPALPPLPEPPVVKRKRGRPRKVR
jgi:hypothetical protein